MATRVGLDQAEPPSSRKASYEKNIWETTEKVAGFSAKALGTLGSNTTYLTLEGIHFEAIGLSEFHNIISRYSSNLATLALKDCSGMDIGSMNLLMFQFRKVTSLSLDHCKDIQSTAIEKINDLIFLTNLTLSHCGLTDDQLLSLTNCPRLEFLNLTGSRITDRSLQAINQFPKLKCLDIRECEAITPSCVETLQAARPDLKIRYRDGFVPVGNRSDQITDTAVKTLYGESKGEKS